MPKDNGHIITLRCDCGHEFEEGLAGKDIQAYEFKCPACGVGTNLTTEQIDAITSPADDAVEQLKQKFLGLDLGPGWIKQSKD